MKIGVNAAPLLKPFTGIGQYTKNLFKELAAIDPENEYLLVVHKELNGVGFPKNVRVVVLPEKKFPLAGMRKTWWEQISLPEFFEKEKVDIAFFPYPSNPWTKDWYKKGIKTVVTVHDCIPWKHKQYRKGLLSKMYHAQTKKAVKWADLVFTVSKASRKDLIDICDVAPEKVRVVYNDAGEAYKKAGDSSILAELGLKKGRYFLYCGGYDERKNVEFLVEEYLSGDFDFPLVLAGGQLFNSKLYGSIDKVADKSGVLKTGFLEEAKLAGLYQNCLAFVHLSKEEGFNIPLLEAANCGAPLILSNIPVHREVAGEAAMFVELKKGSAVAMIKHCLDNEVRERFSRKSQELAQNYSWKTSAKKVKDMLFS